MLANKKPDYTQMMSSSSPTITHINDRKLKRHQKEINSMTNRKNFSTLKPLQTISTLYKATQPDCCVRQNFVLCMP